MRRARVVLLLALTLCAAFLMTLLAPAALAQAPEGSTRIVVRLASSLGENLSVEILAEVPSTLFLPNNATIVLGVGERANYTVPVARPSPSFLVAPADDVLPRGAHAVTLIAPANWTGLRSEGAVVFARDLHVDERILGESRRRLAGAGEPRDVDLALIERGAAYLAAQHPGAPLDILVVRVPMEIATEPLTIGDTILLPVEAGVDEAADALVRLHQGYRVVEVAPTSASWFREGEERMQTQMTLMAAGLRSASELDETFARARAVADPDARLTQAPGGSTFSRNKGLVVVRALDGELRNATHGAAGLADLLATLDETEGRLDSAAIEAAARGIGGDAIARFFERHVYGTEWPEMPTVRDAADVFVTALAVSPARVAPSEPIAATYTVVNRGTQPSELDLLLLLDGAPVVTHPTHLDVGERSNGSLSLSSREPGDHAVGLGARSTELHVLSPPRLTLARASTTPDAPRAGEPFTLLVYVENAGELAGRARLEVHEGERLLQRTTPAFIEGETTDALTLPLSIDAAGLHALDIRLLGDAVEPGAGAVLVHTIDIALSGEDRDAPGLLVGLLLAGVGAAALMMRRP